MGIQLAKGRNFSPVLASDSQAAIINQAMARKMGLTHPVGQRINWGQGQGISIIGVVKDFNFESVKQKIGPLCLMPGKWTTTVVVAGLCLPDDDGGWYIYRRGCTGDGHCVADLELAGFEERDGQSGESLAVGAEGRLPSGKFGIFPR
jgi:hypothetical protein